MKNILIVIPAYREHKNILNLLNKIFLNKSKKYNFYPLIVDDSDDLLTQNIINNSKFKKKIYFIKRLKKSGRGSAVIEGMKFFLKKNKKKFDLLIEMDADLSHKPSELKRNVGFFLKNNSDLLISSRYLKNSKIINWPVSRKLFSYFSNFLAKIVLNIPVSDYTNGFRIYSKRSVIHCVNNCGKIGDGFIILSEILLSLYLHKFKINEIKSTFKNRIRGESSVSVGEIIKSIIGLIKLFFLKINFRKKL